MSAAQYGVWDTSFNDWDSGPYLSLEEARRYTYVPALPVGADASKYRASKSLVVREWLSHGEPGNTV
jgi:hypothetical protein